MMTLKINQSINVSQSKNQTPRFTNIGKHFKRDKQRVKRKCKKKA